MKTHRSIDDSPNMNLLLPESVIDAIAKDISKKTERKEMSTISSSSVQNLPSTLPHSERSVENYGQTWWPPIETGVGQTQDLRVEATQEKRSSGDEWIFSL